MKYRMYQKEISEDNDEVEIDIPKDAIAITMRSVPKRISGFLIVTVYVITWLEPVRD
jgi:hypothetical protein